MNYAFSRNLSLILLSICIAAARPANLLAENVLIFSSGSKVIDSQLQAILQAYGHSATISPPFANFVGNGLESQKVVILMNLDAWLLRNDMPTEGQDALVDFISRGGGLITNAWAVWKWTVGADYFWGRSGLEHLGLLFPLERVSNYGYTNRDGTLTLMESTTDPILSRGMPSSFSFWVDGLDEAGTEAFLVPKLASTIFYDSLGTYFNGVSYPTNPDGSRPGRKSASLVGWRVGAGHVLQFSTLIGPNELGDPLYSRLLANAVTWAGHENRGPLVTELHFDRDVLESGEPLAATFVGADLTDNTYFDVRFRVPGSTTNEVALNWQQGTSDRHTLLSGTGAGEWTVTGVRAHQNKDDHTGEFDPVSGVFTVTREPR
jgi:hypothetical protein